MSGLEGVGAPQVTAAVPVAADVEAAREVPAGERPRRPRRSVARALVRGRGLVGLVLVSVVLLAGLLAPWLAPYDPTQQIPGANLVPPGGAHLLGTDEVNRDLLSRTLFGIRVDLVVVFVAVPIGALLGGLVGLLSTTAQLADVVAQRLFDVVLAFPTLILGILLTAVLGPGLFTISVVIVAAEIPVFGRLIRSAVLTVREMPYVEASRVIGSGRLWVLRRHVLPNVLEPVIVQVAISMSVAVFVEGAMSFLGIGVRPPSPSLGSLVRDGARNMYDAPWFAVGPLVVVVALVLGFLLIAQALSRARLR
ncbi:ABC transporter permease [Nocardioides sp. HDW12B]|uniref:ABC transporter permease n=1 Tax=Nocardioides sp. HDW12B TaxID=2714939 RepID=UPI0014073DF9|nr:ABC transporter permease [Nocardioides sp. HDW12B]QIK68197.1 ABC transporter permease [Nocardioides sp. HDW12B]